MSYYGESTLLKKYLGDDSQSFTTYSSTKANTAQYSYTFHKWSTTKNASTPSSNALSSVTADHTLYGVFTSIVRSYSVL